MTGRNIFLTDTKRHLHERFNPRSDQIPPVRIKRFKRENLAELLNELGLRTGAEIGVAEGRYSRVLCEKIRGHKLYCVDLWGPYTRNNKKMKNQIMQNDAYAAAVENLSPFNTELIRESSMKAVNRFRKKSLDFVYIDGDHTFDFVMSDLIWWSQKVRPGGIVAGHDAYRFRGAGVVDAVSTYTTVHQINEWYLCDERESSFFWAKP